NCRMGDPETEVVIPRMEEDLVDLFIELKQPKAFRRTAKTTFRAAVTTVAVSQGYPGPYSVGKPITGFEQDKQDILFYHAGTRLDTDGQVITAGGRVLAVTALAASLSEAAYVCRQSLQQIQFEGMYYRRDIGYEFEDPGIR
ncbi:MAG: phosphoribosylglycinamide synthetase C domain-containing protein, partial [Ferruginibacter sp.]